MSVPAQVILSEAPPIADTAEGEMEEMVREHSRLIYKISYSLLRNHHDAEDATQEIFLRCLRYRKQLPGVRDRRAWLARMAWRVAGARRARPLEISLEEAERTVLRLREEGRPAEEIAANQQMLALLGRLIAGLPRELRETLALSTVEELSSSEIAEVLEIPEGSVRSRLSRARQILKEKLAAVLEGKHRK